MSVVKSQRKENKLDVFVKAQYLSKYTIEICCNEKVFTPKYYNAITSDIMKHAKDIYIKAWNANNVVITDRESYKRRMQLHNEAIDNCIALQTEISIAKPLFHLKMKRVIYWHGKVKEVKAMLMAWRDSIKNKYKEFS